MSSLPAWLKSRLWLGQPGHKGKEPRLAAWLPFSSSPVGLQPPHRAPSIALLMGGRRQNFRSSGFTNIIITVCINARAATLFCPKNLIIIAPGQGSCPYAPSPLEACRHTLNLELSLPRSGGLGDRGRPGPANHRKRRPPVRLSCDPVVLFLHIRHEFLSPHQQLPDPAPEGTGRGALLGQ
jgi:hypothetical protein